MSSSDCEKRYSAPIISPVNLPGSLKLMSNGSLNMELYMVLTLCCSLTSNVLSALVEPAIASLARAAFHLEIPSRR